MNRKMLMAVVGASLAVVLPGGLVFARGFGGGGRGEGGFRGGSGDSGGFRGGYGDMSSFGRTPSFSSPRSFDTPGGFGEGVSNGSRGAAEGMEGGRIEYGSRSGSYTTSRGGTIDYGAAGYGARGPGGAEAGRGVSGIEGTTAGGRSDSDVGRVGGVGPEGAFGASERGGMAAGTGGVVAGRGDYGASAMRPYGYNAYGADHAGWVHGYWNGHDSAAWGWRSPYWGAWGAGLGNGLGWGLASWGFGSSLYGLGYMPYANPYDDAGAGGVAAVPFDYSQPIDTASAPAADSVANPALALFDAGRASFRRGNYADALQQADAALAKLPNDTTLHEFRALCLFALGRYDEAAATLYAVLSVGPGWDWTTLIGLYPGVDAYTAQLRALEEYCTSHTESATGRFVLAYQYLTEGHTEASVDVLGQVVALKPGDTLSAKLLRQLDPPKDRPAAAAVPTSPPTDTTPPQGASIAGTWGARPAADTAIALTVQPGGGFTWQVTRKDRQQRFSGASTYGDGILTLAQDKGPALVGRVSWKDASHMTFRIVGDGPDDPGLSFSK